MLSRRLSGSASVSNRSFEASYGAFALDPDPPAGGQGDILVFY